MFRKSENVNKTTYESSLPCRFIYSFDKNNLANYLMSVEHYLISPHQGFIPLTLRVPVQSFKNPNYQFATDIFKLTAPHYGIASKLPFEWSHPIGLSWPDHRRKIKTSFAQNNKQYHI